MPLSKLSIFSKDTDANAVLKGYEYQKLKTLETWLQNKINNRDEIIFCEYEDDIFQRNLNVGTSKFTQVKLYTSKNFSFNSEEIKKSIANFFMIFVKGEYSFDEVEFIFETNTSIARKYGDNDGDLLKEWTENQARLEDDLLKRCSNKVKAILDEYIKEQFPKAQERDKSTSQKAKLDFDNLPASVWEDFVKTIRWNFTDEESNTAIEITVKKIKEYIKQLPFPSLGDKLDPVFTTLYYEVSERMFQDEHENRCLTNQKLDSLILDLGDDADKQYNIAFQAWQGVSEIKFFRLSEFLEVVHSANHCRWSIYLKDHSDFWIHLLKTYIEHPDTPNNYKSKAIYQFLWLQLRPQKTGVPIGTLKGVEGYIEKYYDHAFNDSDHEAVSDHFSLLQIVKAAIAMKSCDLPMERTNEWLTKIGEIIEQKLQTVNIDSEKCFWLELKAQYFMHPFDFDGKGEKLDNVFEYFNAILTLLPNAQLYNVKRLNDRINQFIEILIQFEATEQLVEELELFAEKLVPYVSQRNGNHVAAKTYVDRGINYLHTENPQNISKALSLFHKAKDLWLAGETVEGHVLALLNIAQLYLVLKMNLAAKYYVLSAAWLSINSNPEKLAKRIASSFGFLVHCDYKQGSWINALTAFKYYMVARSDFDPRPFDENDRQLMKSFVELGHIIKLAPEISPALSVLIEIEKNKMGRLYTEFIDPIVTTLDEHFQKEDYKEYLQKELDASAINDIGPTRTIEFKAFGSIWKINFPNNWAANSLGEEYASVLQVLLVELSYSTLDLHFIKTEIEIEVEQVTEWKPPEQKPSNTHFKWKAFSTRVDSPDGQPIKLQMPFILTSLKFILREVSLLDGNQFFDHVDNLFRNNALAGKAMTINLYQRIYRGLFDEENFNRSQRNNFPNALLPIMLKQDEIMKWQSGLSKMYSEEKSLEYITGRVRNCLKKIGSELNYLKQQKGYKEFIDGWRTKGWLDWQILLAMFNHIMSYKANRMVPSKEFSNEEETHKAFQKAFEQVMKMDPKDTYIEFPLSYFTESQNGFELMMNQTAHLAIHTWGLENRSHFPNFPALRDFLNHRFNFGVDDIKESSLL